MASKLATCQLLVDPPAEGAWNMAVDEALLNVAAQSEQPVLRFYEWERPTLSLGYFQQAADRQQHAASADADLVRRLSGGGAILHDRELTYSLVLPAAHPLAQDTQPLYSTLHLVLAEMLNAILRENRSAWQAFLNDQPTAVAARDEPFLCFERRAVGDILLRPADANATAPTQKIVGSAQRRRRGAVLQHGSILLAPSSIAPELRGFVGTTQTPVHGADIVRQLPDLLENALGLRFERATLPKSVSFQARALREAKYLSDDWVQRR